ncbi:MAG: hypothetical protein ABR606_13385 [Vicinamibacterales bacterium]
MAESFLRRESPLEFFREQVGSACERQGLHARPTTEYYVVSLLAAFADVSANGPGEAMTSNEPLGLKLLRAMESGGADMRTNLRRVGDVSLFISGFFSDSLRRSLVDIDYYVSIGGYAYGSLGREAGDPMAETFEELSAKFVSFVDVLAEVSERSALTRNSDLLRLYDRWVKTGSKRNGDLLAERGLVPPTARSKRIQ